MGIGIHSESCYVFIICTGDPGPLLHNVNEETPVSGGIEQCTSYQTPQNVDNRSVCLVRTDPSAGFGKLNSPWESKWKLAS